MAEGSAIRHDSSDPYYVPFSVCTQDKRPGPSYKELAGFSGVFICVEVSRRVLFEHAPCPASSHVAFVFAGREKKLARS